MEIYFYLFYCNVSCTVSLFTYKIDKNHNKQVCPDILNSVNNEANQIKVCYNWYRLTTYSFTYYSVSRWLHQLFCWHKQLYKHNRQSFKLFMVSYLANKSDIIIVKLFLILYDIQLNITWCLIKSLLSE